VTNITANAQPAVSAIVPARNEQATIEQCVESLAQQPEITEIIVVNDQSTDRTTEIVQELMCKHPQLRLLESAALPPGWVGKNHAAWQGARAAKGDWLLFTDADVIHERHSAARALGIAGVQATDTGGTAIPGCAPSQAKPLTNIGKENSGTVTPDSAPGSSAHPQLISFSPEQITETWYEKSLIPVIYCRLAQRFDFADVIDPHKKAAAANGQFLLISREVYDAVGGHAAIASEVLEDVALARRVKESGYRIWFGSGQGIVRVRMYRTFAAMWEGWKKNLYRLMGGDPASIAAEIAIALVPILVSVFVVAAIAAFTRDWRVTIFVAAIALTVWHRLYRMELRHYQYSGKLVWYGLPGKLLYAAVLWASWRSHQIGRLSWKGREYPVGTPSASKR
jgi:glycosyltransferase involved in cell wall biosynthesis